MLEQSERRNRKVKNIPEYFNDCSIYFELNMSRVREVIFKTFSTNEMLACCFCCWLPLLLLLRLLLLSVLLVLVCSMAWLESFCRQIDSETYCLLTRFCALATYSIVRISSEKFASAFIRKDCITI